MIAEVEAMPEIKEEAKTKELVVAPDNKTLFRQAIAKLLKIEKELKDELYEREELVHLSLLALLTGGHLVAIGEPGTAKSMTIELLCNRIINDDSQENLKLFKVLLSADTKAEEVYGPYDLLQLAKGVYLRKTDWYLPWAEVAFLDEIFNAPGYLLKTTLQIMNEKVFKNGDSPVWEKVPLNSVFGATNQLPVEDHQGDLAAMFDRFDFRLFIQPLSDGGFSDAFDEMCDTPAQKSNNPDSPFTTMSMAELRAIQNYVNSVEVPRHIREAVKNLKIDLKNMEIRPTDRRCLKNVPRILKAEAIMNKRVKVDDDDLKILENVLWTKEDEIPKIKKAINKFGNPHVVKATEIMEEATNVIQNWRSTMDNPSIVDDDKSKISWETSRKIYDYLRQLKTIQKSMEKEGRTTEKIAGIANTLITQKQTVDQYQTGEDLI